MGKTIDLSDHVYMLLYALHTFTCFYMLLHAFTCLYPLCKLSSSQELVVGLVHTKPNLLLPCKNPHLWESLESELCTIITWCWGPLSQCPRGHPLLYRHLPHPWPQTARFWRPPAVQLQSPLREIRDGVQTQVRVWEGLGAGEWGQHASQVSVVMDYWIQILSDYSDVAFWTIQIVS